MSKSRVNAWAIARVKARSIAMAREGINKGKRLHRAKSMAKMKANTRAKAWVSEVKSDCNYEGKCEGKRG